MRFCMRVQRWVRVVSVLASSSLSVPSTTKVICPTPWKGFYTPRDRACSPQRAALKAPFALIFVTLVYMTRKEGRRSLAVALREQRSAEEEVREANARVVEATSKLPPYYVEKRLAGGAQERIQRLIDRAQKASDHLGMATADVVNLRRLVAMQQSQTPSSGRRHHAMTKKSRVKQPLSGWLLQLKDRPYYWSRDGRWLKDIHEAKRFRLEHEALTLSNQLHGAVVVPVEAVEGVQRQRATKKSAAQLDREIHKVVPGWTGGIGLSK